MSEFDERLWSGGESELEGPAFEDDISGGGRGRAPDEHFWDIFFRQGEVDYLEPGSPQYNEAEAAFQRGFVDEAVSTEEREEARQAYFDSLGIDDSQFDWEAWREAMGY